MEPHKKYPKSHPGKFPIEKHQYGNVGLTERFISVFAGGILLSQGLKNPSKPKFLYGAYLAYRGFTGRCLFYEYLGIDARKPQAINIRSEFVIDRPAHEVYNYWHNLKNPPESLNHLMEIVKDEPGHLIGWRSATDTAFHHVGRVEFDETPDGMGTLLKIVLSYHPIAGGFGIGVGRLLNPYFEHLLTKEIKTFKHQVELPV